MNRDTIELRLQAMVAEAIQQACEAANRQIDEAGAAKLARRFDDAVAEVATAIDSLPRVPEEKKSN